jgi:uncharacterized protein YjbJ (UPF0337 family)
MHRIRIAGAGRVISGGLKETAGKLTGDRALQVRGVLEKSVGRVQAAVGRAADSLSEARSR